MHVRKIHAVPTPGLHIRQNDFSAEQIQFSAKHPLGMDCPGCLDYHFMCFGGLCGVLWQAMVCSAASPH